MRKTSSGVLESSSRAGPLAQVKTVLADLPSEEDPFSLEMDEVELERMRLWIRDGVFASLLSVVFWNLVESALKKENPDHYQ